MKHEITICFVLGGLLAIASAQDPKQITRFMILDGWDDTLFGITHDLKSSPINYDTKNANELPIMQPLAPTNYFVNRITSDGYLSFDYDAENKVVYFGSSGHWAIYRINPDGSGLEPAFSSEYVFAKHLLVDGASNTAYFSAFALSYVNRSAVVTDELYFSSSSLDKIKLAYVVVKANILTGETEELFYSRDLKAFIFNKNYNLMFLVGTTTITVMTMDKKVVDVIPLPPLTSAVESTVFYDRSEDVIYLVYHSGYASIFYLRYATQESGVITISASLSAGYAWHDAVNKAFYFMASGSATPVYHLGYQNFDALISRNTYLATQLFTLRQSAYGIFALACDSTSVDDCGWNTTVVPTYLVVLIVMFIVLPCAGCIGLIVALCKRRELNFPVDQWANMPLNQEPDRNDPEQ